MISYDGWDREYSENRDQYINLFDQFMADKNYEDVEFFEKSFGDFINRKHVVGVSNATEALRFSLLALGIGPGDEVLVTDFSWISSASCISMVGAKPVFCDIDLDTYHISLESIKRMVSEKTKAIVYTHLFGSMSDCDSILDFCKERQIAFLEDAAQSLGSSLNGVQAGTIGDCSSFSFNSNKVIAGINGGGVFLTDDNELARKVRLLRRHGKDKDFSLLGFNAKLYGLNGEIILSRLKRWKEFQLKRQKIAAVYDKAFKGAPVWFQVSPSGLDHNYHKYTIRLEDKESRKKVKNALRGSIHYERPLSKNSMYQFIDHRKDDCVNAAHVADTILSLPIHPWLTDKEVSQVCQIVLDTLGVKKPLWQRMFN